MGSEYLSFQTYRPFFDGIDYPFWKHKMKLYLDSDPIWLWDVILDGWNPPIERVEGVEVLENRGRWSKEEKEENLENKRVMTILIAFMSREEGGKLQHCISAKEMWETL